MVVTRLRRPPADRFGDRPDTPVTTIVLPGAFIAPVKRVRGGGDILERGREGSVAEFFLYAAFGADVAHDDQIEADGVLYDVDGQPSRWATPWGDWAPGCEVALRRAVG